jgi:phosphogluconate dehydratase
MLAKVRDGDPVRIDAGAGRLELGVDKEELARREWVEPNLESHRTGMGRQIFAPLRSNTMGADEGASALFTYVHERCQITPFREGD